ncbi:MAG: ATP-binding protein [Thermosulfidibacteraceae bacterium]
MKPFTQIAIPHEDIVKGRLTMDVFAADLWNVVNGNAPIDYQDPDLFFKKTYLTEGLRHILDIAKSRLDGKTGDSIIHLQTPFGGGKTHTLIALYHKAKEWKAKVVVLDGTALDAKKVKLWEELERQLTGKIEITKGDIAPGKEALLKLLSENAPALILMDEVLEYITKAAGIKVGDSNLASQTFAFIQELTGAISAIGKALLALTLPSSTLEHYDENAERMFQQLQKITGRVERIFPPVKDEEIASVIRARLFSKVDEKEAKKVVDDFVEYAKKEGLLSGDEALDYRESFLKSYPFKPEVINVLYHRWGSFPTFQRTRGVLRILSLVVHDLLGKNIPFIRLGDFNLDNEELRRELVKHIGQEWESIIAQDITSKDSGAKRVDKTLGSSYLPYKLGTVVSTTIFMSSFSGKGEKGSGLREIKIREIKLSTIEPSFSSTVIDTVISNLREKLFYLSDEGLFFTNQPNLNRIIISREENISESEIEEEEKKIIQRHISRDNKFRIYPHPKFPKDIPDNEELKLIILKSDKPDIDFIEKHGESPRVFRNTIIFLCVDETQREAFHSYIRKLIALRHIEQDKTLRLSDSQKSELKNKLKNHESREYEELRKFYRKLFVPSKGGFKEIDIGVPTIGETELDKEIYNYLKNKGEILEKISHVLIKQKYLMERGFLPIKDLYESFLRTPGELRVISKEGFLAGVKEGVSIGTFGFGYLKDGIPECIEINKLPDIKWREDEIIIQPELCKKKEEPKTPEISIEAGEQKMEAKSEQFDKSVTPSVEEEFQREPKERTCLNSIALDLNVPFGKLSDFARIMSFLKGKFKDIKIMVHIEAKEGKIEQTEYEDKIIEALSQAGIEIKNQNKNFIN